MKQLSVLFIRETFFELFRLSENANRIDSMRYELKVQLSTELEIEVVQAAIESIGKKSGAVNVHWVRSQIIGKIGAPAKIEPLILAYLDEQQYPKSAKQIGSAIQVAPTSLYRILYRLNSEGTLAFVEDGRWKSKRFGYPEQVERYRAREEARRAKYTETPWNEPGK